MIAMAFLKFSLSVLFASALCAAASDRMYCGQYDTLTSASTQNICKFHSFLHAYSKT
jgi:hypothetical protein